MNGLINYEAVTFGNFKILPVIEQDGPDKGKCKLIITELEGGIDLIIRPVASNRIEITTRQ